MSHETWWVMWIENGSDGKARAMFTNEAHLKFDKALNQLRSIRKNANVVCAWIDHFDGDNKKIGTPVMECYVNAFGDREMWRFKEETTTFGDRFDKVIQSGEYPGKKAKVEALAQLIYANDRSRDKESCLAQALDEYELMTGSYWDPTHDEYAEALASII